MRWPFRCFTLSVDLDCMFGLALVLRRRELIAIVGFLAIRLEVLR